MDFVPNMNGTLISLEEDENSRFKYEIWFDYTRQAMNLIREGAMLAVPNFASDNKSQHLSILEVVTILPMHYALGNDTRGYPGFIVEAAKSVVNDWEEQDNESTEDTTKIRCVAIPTNLEVVQIPGAQGKPKLQEESNLPMVGGSARLLDTEFTEYIANYGIKAEENTFVGGTLIRDSNVKVYLRIEDFLRTHFGVFGFTGAGKSNLISTLLSRVLRDSKEPLKIVFFDLMGEYTTLLIDELLRDDIDAYVVCLGENTLPRPVFQYINKEPGANLAKAVTSLRRYILLPKALTLHISQIEQALHQLLIKERIKIYNPIEDMTLYYLFFDGTNDKRPAKYKERRGSNVARRNDLLEKFVREQGGTNKVVDAQVARDVLNALRVATQSGGLLAEFRDDVAGVMDLLESAIPKLEKQLQCAILSSELVDMMNDTSKSSLIIVNSHNPDELRSFASTIGNQAFESRRRTGEIEPLVSFIFDEADEFIPQQASGSYQASSDIAMTLARRGRKFGLGIGIATQRVRYLNTSIMAQPHTYLVSKMPRISDRQVVAEAFGTSEEMFRQTFKFKKGDWLLMSYDATGLEAIPIPIHSEDANERIIRFLNDLPHQA